MKFNWEKFKKKLSPYFALWALLAIALVCFVIVSFREQLSIGSWKMQQGSFKETLLKEPPQAESGADLLVSETRKTEEGSDSTVHKLLLIGDSMTILVGNRMAYYGAQNDYDVTSVTWYSSSTQVWGECDTLAYFIKEYDPDFIVVTLGSNELFIRNIDDRSKYVEKLMKTMGDIPFVWIGPPNWKEDTGINDMLERTLPKGTFFKTNGMQLERGGDHVHPTQKAADLWTDSIMRWMPKSRHPILANFPDTVSGTPNHTKKLLAPPQ